jgi:aminoglycoside phosphotransferase (APT) family kinase protein
MADTLVAPRTRDLDVLARHLSAWLGERMPQARDIAVRNLTYPSGAGMSHETILFDAAWSEDGRAVHQGLVVRVKPVANMVFPDDLFDSQYRVMRLIHDRQWIPVAEPLWFEASDAVIGAPFFVMKKVVGRVPVSQPPYAERGWIVDASPAQRATLWENAVRTLAAIHRLPVGEFTFLAGPEGAASGLEQEWDKYTRFVEWVSAERRWSVLDAAVRMLRERWPANQPPGLVWGGAEMVNMMFDENFAVAAVMDWEQPSLGGPLNDLAWWLYMADMKHGPASGRPPLAGLGTRADTIALWSEATGISARDIEWYEDFMALKIACLGTRMMTMRGMPPPDHAALARRFGIAI